jgi:Ca2+-binding EF-hand superfamily protein
MATRRNLPLLLLAASANITFAQPPPGKQTQPLGDVLHLVLDSNKDSFVTQAEVKAQISMLELLFDKSADYDDAGRENKKYLSNKEMLQSVKAVAPTLFKLLDSNGDSKLTKKEMEYMTKFEKSLKKNGGFRDFLRDVFFVIDTNGDDLLSVEELYTVSQSEKGIREITSLFHKLFPLRTTASELEVFVKNAIESLGGTESIDEESVKKAMEWIDDDGDGLISRKEVGHAYNVYGKQFLEISATVKTMGPLMAMFGGNGGDLGAMFGNPPNKGGGAERAGSGFKMDL